MRIIILCATFYIALAPPAALAQKEPNPVVVVQTNVGDITIELFKDQVPATVANFLGYATSNFYSGTIFHRVIKGFMIQGGGFTPQLRAKKTGPPIKNEASSMNKNMRGTVAAARSSGIHSATSQFFINTENNVALDHKSIRPDEYGYTVFGKVIEGMDVVDKIERIKTNSKDVPQSLVMITKVYLRDRE
ncbi:MAG: peptidylprolyl isomerase [Vicinamibacterales bacterium]|nr:peptidylprolyl isomerase [Vicinamibacterales bacterium]